MDLSTLSDEQLMQAAGGDIAPASTPIDYSSLSDEQLMQAAGINSSPQQPDGFMQRLQADFTRRKGQIGGLKDLANSGGISQAEGAVRSGLKMAQLLPDTAGNVLSTVTPDFIEKPIVQGIGDAASYLADTRAGRAAIGAVNDFNTQYPITAGRIGSVGDVLNIALPFAKVRGTSLVSASSDAVEGGGKLAAAGAKKVASSVLPGIDEGLQEIAGLANKYNIPLSLDQVSSSRALKNVQKVSQELPFSGQAGFRDKQMSAFNKAIFKTVGVDADKFTPATMDLAFSKVGGEFDSVTKGKNFRIGGDFVDNIAKSLDEVESAYGKEAAAIYGKEALKVIDDFKGDDIAGELIARQRGRINALARKAGPGQKEALLDLENNIVDGITSGDPKIQKALAQAKQRYKNLIVLEPIANKAKGGNISPSLLNNRVSDVYKRLHTRGQSGEIGELARIGYELLPQLGGSDTTQKLLTAGVIGGGLTNPATITPAIAAVTGNRAFQAAINRNQSLIGAAVKKAEAKAKARLTKEDLQKAFEAQKGIQ